MAKRTIQLSDHFDYPTLLVRMPVSYIMSMQPNASLTHIGYAAPLATVFGIIINAVYFIRLNRKMAGRQ